MFATLVGLVPSVAAQVPLVPRVDAVSSWHAAPALRARAADGTATRLDLLRLAEMELALGRATRAIAILEGRFPPDAPDADRLILLGMAAHETGDFANATDHFAQAASILQGRDRGILLSRAGDAAQRAGNRSEARVHYAKAAHELPAIAGWLAIREAAVSDAPLRSMELLRHAPPEAERFAAAVRADVFLAVGDSGDAIPALVRSGQLARAVEVAAALGNTAVAREHTYALVRSTDTTELRLALARIDGGLAPESAEEFFRVAAAYSRLGRSADALRVLAQAVVATDSSPAALVRLGDQQAASGKRDEALRSYERAAQAGPEDAVASYRAARLVIRMGRQVEGYSRLAAFADRHSDHAEAPLAAYLVGDWHRDGGRDDQADSVLAELARRWPASGYASRARLGMAREALTRADTAAAEQWYRDEIDAGAPQRRAAQYFLARITANRGDEGPAGQLWADLVTADPFGYYGTMARQATGATPPYPAPVPPALVSPAAATVLEQIDLLQASSLHAETEALVARARAADGYSADELLDLAEGFIERGWVQEGVSLGWEVARSRSLRDARVVRVVFPWPMRSMIEREAIEHGLDPHLLAALIRQESTFRTAVVSHAGAYGLMQLMPPTARELARRVGLPWDERLLTVGPVNLHLGATHLASLLRTYRGDVIAALAAYNAGGRPVSRWLRYPEANDPPMFVERIPYVETRGYLRSVLRNWALYQGLYPTAEAAEADER